MSDEKDSAGRYNPGRFKPGSSGNPGGRPKGLERVVNETIAAMVEVVEDPETKQQVKLNGWQQITRKLFKMALDGSVPAAKLLFERAGGYPKQKVDLAGEVATKQHDLAPLTKAQLEALATLDLAVEDDDGRTPTTH